MTNLPKKIIVGDIIYKIRYLKRMRDFGEIDLDNRIIRIRINSPDTKNALLHEVLHAIEDYFAIEATEQGSECYANGLRMVFLNNPDLKQILED